MPAVSAHELLPLCTAYDMFPCCAQVQMLPVSLEAATERIMRPESIAREEAVFGNDFVEHFGGTRQHEVRLWNQAVTNWEGSSSVLAGRAQRTNLTLLAQWRDTWNWRDRTDALR